MNWYKRYLKTKYAQRTMRPPTRKKPDTVTRSQPVEQPETQSPSTVSPQPIVRPSIPAKRQQPPPNHYWDIADSGHPDIENNDCEVFVWLWGGGNTVQIEEVNSNEHTHDTQFPGMNRQKAFYGRFSSCSGRASLSVPSSASMRDTPPAVVNAIVKTFGRRGLKEIWEFRDNSAPQLVWNG